MSKKTKNLINVLNANLEAIAQNTHEINISLRQTVIAIADLNIVLRDFTEHVKKEGLKWRQR